MKVKYFTDTDTAHLEFTDKQVHETKEISENIYVDLDGNGDLAIWLFQFRARYELEPIYILPLDK